MIRQGDVFWLDLGRAPGSGPAFRHPHVVVQNDIFNASPIATTVVCTITSNLKRGLAHGNVRLEVDEANLPKPCVINISQLYTVDKEELVERIGTLPRERLVTALDGLGMLFDIRDPSDVDSGDAW